MVTTTKYQARAIWFLFLFSSLFMFYAYYPTTTTIEDHRATLYTYTPTPAPIAAKTRDVNCLSEAIYFEARNQPIKGQKAVAHVVLNRMQNGDFPSTVCGVIHQKNRGVCQFSYFCEKHKLIKDSESYQVARDVAKQVLKGERDFTRGATYYHANYVRPGWSRKYDNVLNIGDHLFYRRDA